MKPLMTGQRFLVWATMVLAMPLLAACGGNYYQVTDVSSGKAYYTRDVDHENGHVRFTDKANGDEVNLDAYEVREITKQQYRNAVRK